MCALCVGDDVGQRCAPLASGYRGWHTRGSAADRRGCAGAAEAPAACHRRRRSMWRFTLSVFTFKCVKTLTNVRFCAQICVFRTPIAPPSPPVQPETPPVNCVISDSHYPPGEISFLLGNEIVATSEEDSRHVFPLNHTFIRLLPPSPPERHSVAFRLAETTLSGCGLHWLESLPVTWIFNPC